MIFKNKNFSTLLGPILLIVLNLFIIGPFTLFAGNIGEFRFPLSQLIVFFILAAIIAYLLMAALFGNFIYPLIIMFTLPLAAVGGLLGLKLVNWLITPQPFDILTMLGFIILVGVVVNNAILIVHQALNNVRVNGMPYQEAVLESTRTRLRPIYMSAATSIFGMLPLVLIPGPGSEFYRGLGSVVLGGLAVSTVFTVLVIPSLLMFAIKMERPKE